MRRQPAEKIALVFLFVAENLRHSDGGFAHPVAPHLRIKKKEKTFL